MKTGHLVVEAPGSTPDVLDPIRELGVAGGARVLRQRGSVTAASFAVFLGVLIVLADRRQRQGRDPVVLRLLLQKKDINWL